jgi:putative hydrolase of the HAD superfamily
VNFDFRLGYKELEAVCGHPAADIPKQLAPTGLVEKFETGLVEPKAFFEEFCRILDLQIEYKRFCEIWSCIFTHALLPETMLEGLARRYRLVLLSNTNALHFEMLRETYQPWLRHFHAEVLSYEVHSMKPDAAIFHAAVKAAGCAPHECWYTDDIASNVEAAKAIGMDAVVFESREQIERELRSRGIEWS